MQESFSFAEKGMSLLAGTACKSIHCFAEKEEQNVCGWNSGLEGWPRMHSVH
jgi:hypothetical protein